MATNRQQLIHLHGTTTPDVAKMNEKEVVVGEIVVKHADDEQALFTRFGENGIAKFITESAIDAKILVETNRAKGVEEGIDSRLKEVENVLGVGEDVSGVTISSRVEELEGLVGKPSEGDTPASGVYAEVEANAAAIAQEVKDREAAVKAEADRAKGIEEGLQSAIDAINNTESGILATAKGYTDEQLKAFKEGDFATLSGKVAANETAIGVLNGDAETEGSVAKAVADAEARVKVTTDALDQRVGKNETDIATLQGQVGALTSATHFEGKFETLEDALAAVDAKGDIVIVGPKEYIYNADVTEGVEKSVENFVELGDTTAELEAIDALQKADEGFKTRLETIEGEGEGSIKKAAADALAAAKQYTDDELSAFVEGDFTTLSGKVAANETAIADEAKSREDADTALGERIDGVLTTIEENEKVTAAALTDLDTRATAAETTLGEHTTAIAANEAAISAEATARETADNALSARIDAVSVVAGDGISVSAAQDSKAFTVAVTTINCGEY